MGKLCKNVVLFMHILACCVMYNQSGYKNQLENTGFGHKTKTKPLDDAEVA